MLKQTTIKPTKILVSTKPDGSVCLAVSAGDRFTVELEISAELWAKLGEDARWFAELTTHGVGL